MTIGAGTEFIRLKVSIVYRFKQETFNKIKEHSVVHLTTKEFLSGALTIIQVEDLMWLCWSTHVILLERWFLQL
jgi:hypothetical protein